MSPEELREWVKFLVLIVGGGLALRTYVVSQRQRRLENSLKLIDLFFDNLEDNDIDEWKRIFVSSSEPSGAKQRHFYSSNNQQIPFECLFSEAPDDNGANNRIVEQLDLIAYTALNGTIDTRFIYSRLGQLMTTTYSWFGEGDNSIISVYYPHFDKLMRKHKNKFNVWPTKVYSYCD